MIKKLICLTLTLLLLSFLSVPTFASSLSEEEAEWLAEQNSSSGLSLDIPAEYRANVSEEYILADNPIGNRIVDSQEDPITTNQNARTATIYGPYTSLSNISDDKMQIIFNGMKNAGDVYAVTYNGTTCFKFESGNTIIYLACTLFLNESKSTTGVLSTLLTSALNGDTSEKHYITAYASTPSSTAGMSGYAWHFARISAQVGRSNNTEITYKIKIEDAFRVDFYGALYSSVGYPSRLDITPTAGVRITNAGTGGLFLSSFELSGVGESPSAMSIGDLVNLGYLMEAAAGVVSNLSPGTILSLFGSALDLKKESSDHYVAEKILFEIGEGSNRKYVYNCSNEAPQTLREPGDYYLVDIGYRGEITDTARFSVSFTRTLELIP